MDGALVVRTNGGPALMAVPSRFTLAAWAVGGAWIVVSTYSIVSSVTSLALTPPWASHDPGRLAIGLALTSIATGAFSMALPYWVDCCRARRAAMAAGLDQAATTDDATTEAAG